MKWSKEINRTATNWGAPKYFKRHHYLEANGYVRNIRVKCYTIALKNFDEGVSTCPVCGSHEVDIDNMETQFHYEDYGDGVSKPGTDMYIETDCNCKKCGQLRIVFGRVNTGEAVMHYDVPA